jgi:hypothetical protein
MPPRPRRQTLLGIAAWCILPGALPAADPGKELLDAAARGRADQVQALLGKGAALETRDNHGRTALMLAAQHGYPATVRALLEKGADATARDERGGTAWVLAMFSPAGSRAGVDEVLRVLPPPPRPKLVLEGGWRVANLYSSCSMRPDQLTRYVGQLQPDLLALSAFGRYFVASGRNLVEMAAANTRGTGAVPDNQAFEGADAVLSLAVRPEAACQPQQSVDNLRLIIDVQLVRAKDRAVLLSKTFGGGLKGLRAQAVTNQTQYLPVFEEWMKAHVEEIYWAAVEAWFRAA